MSPDSVQDLSSQVERFQNLEDSDRLVRMPPLAFNELTQRILAGVTEW